LYNLADDIGERKNLAGQMPDKVSELHGRLAAWRKAVGAPMPTENTDRRPPRVTRKRAAATRNKSED